MKILYACLLVLMMCSPAFSEPVPGRLYFGPEAIAQKYIVVEITTKKGEKIWGMVVVETEQDLWIITKKRKIVIWPKERRDHITILMIRNKTR